MAGFVDTTVKDIEGRLGELKQEVERLEAARSALLGSGGGARRRPGRPARAASPAASAASAPAAPTRGRRAAARKPGRPRGRRGGNTRANQALELVRQRPGISIPEIASELKIEPNYLYRVMPKLVGDGNIKREGHGWHPAS
ncbi:MAG TPA: hypothetical protein VG223_03605 [Solirubrobacteraceae bacterium]|jgi:hypothetical protein|nr:hypothetical protein [Solirubrobacteraceae bacterium]